LSITGVFINNNARGFLRGSPTTGALLFVGYKVISLGWRLGVKVLFNRKLLLKVKGAVCLFHNSFRLKDQR